MHLQTQVFECIDVWSSHILIYEKNPNVKMVTHEIRTCCSAHSALAFLACIIQFLVLKIFIRIVHTIYTCLCAFVCIVRLPSSHYVHIELSQRLRDEANTIYTTTWKCDIAARARTRSLNAWLCARHTRHLCDLLWSRRRRKRPQNFSSQFTPPHDRTTERACGCWCCLLLLRLQTRWHAIDNTVHRVHWHRHNA